MASPPSHAAPLYLTGHLAPVPDEIDSRVLPVTGTLPPELTGRYLRNGPNPLPGQDPLHWFAGQGMLHGIRLRDGRAEWYRNRWVRTPAMSGAPFVDEDGVLNRCNVVANTHVIEHAGRILTLVESGFPFEVDRELATVGPYDFGGRLTTAMTAHPKTDPRTGELHFFGYGFMPPYLTYHRASADGELVCSADIELPGAVMMHDFAITEHHAVFLDLPMTFQFRPGMPFGWDDGHTARLGVMPLARPGEVRWFDIDPCYVFHVGNAHTDAAGRVVLDAARYRPADVRMLWDGIGPEPTHASDMATSGLARLHRWTLDPATGSVTETPLHDRCLEFPTLDDELVGRTSRYLYAVAAGQDSDNNAIVRYDAQSGATLAYELPRGVQAGEAVFVPADAPDRAEDDGWLLSITTTSDGTASEFLVLDASDLTAPPVARVTLPRGVPAGFHGSWIPDTNLEPA